MVFTRFIANLIRQLRSSKKRRSRRDVALGVALRRDAREPAIVLPEAMRAQHLGILGLSGSGKTYFIEHMVRQDIQNKTGFVLFDVHGDLADSIVAFLAERASVDPEARERTVILEPFDTERSFGFNPLERQKGVSVFLQAQEFAHILRARWKDETLGPRTEELLRNSLHTLCVNDCTLLDLTALLTQNGTRRELVRHVPPAVSSYWSDRYDALSPRMQAVFREPLLTRVSSFVDDPIIRDIVGQQGSTFSFRKAIEQGLWIIINLAKGRLGANSHILGSLLFAKLELEIMSLADVPAGKRRLFAVYADELQNLAGSTFGRLVAEARKYNVALVAGHQFWKQLAPQFREAMLAVGTKVLFRLHYHDALELAGELAPAERNRYVSLLTGLERGEAIVRVLGERPVLLSVPPHRTSKIDGRELAKFKEQSAARYTISRSDLHLESKSRMHPEFDQERGNQGLTAAGL